MEKCPICTDKDMDVIFVAKPLDYSLDKSFQIAKCNECGHGKTLGVGYLPEAYEGGSYDVKEKFWHKLLNPFFNILEKNKIRYVASGGTKKSILEIGCGKGR